MRTAPQWGPHRCAVLGWVKAEGQSCSTSARGCPGMRAHRGMGWGRIQSRGSLPGGGCGTGGLCPGHPGVGDWYASLFSRPWQPQQMSGAWRTRAGGTRVWGHPPSPRAYCAGQLGAGQQGHHLQAHALGAHTLQLGHHLGMLPPLARLPVHRHDVVTLLQTSRLQGHGDSPGLSPRWSPCPGHSPVFSLHTSRPQSAQGGALPQRGPQE